VLVRFRIATDSAVGREGWTIDNVAFTGLANTPFGTVGDDTTTCIAPVANAGPDQQVAASANVSLDGSASSDANNDPLAYAWTQTSGPAVTLSSSTSVSPSFTAPASAATLTFQLTVSDGWGSAMDSVTITVGSSTVIDAAVPDAAMPDAAVPDAAVPDAAVPDAAVPDAAVPDAAVPDAAVPDAAVPTADAAKPMAVDAGTPTPPSDGGCCDSGNERPFGSIPGLLVVAFVVGRRRRAVRTRTGS
jgi:large repetitive protein